MEREFIENVKDALEIEDRELGLNDNFRNYPEWSSLAFLSLVVMLDDKYDVIMGGDTFDKLITLSDILSSINDSK